MTPDGIDGGGGPQRLRRLIQGYRLSQAIHVAAVLGVADHLRDGPRTAEELAARVGAHAPSLARLLRLLASEGVFSEVERDLFALTPTADLLRADAPGSQRTEAMWHGVDDLWRSWGNLRYSVRTGEPAFEQVAGVPFFEGLSARPELARLFDALMVEETRLSCDAVVRAFDFSGARSIVDVGGGRGALLAAVLRSAPAARGVLYDRADVVAGARRLLEEAGVAERCEIRSGDFFESVPASADVYLLKYILHDWDDARCVRILRGIRGAMTEGSRLLVLEMPLPPGDAPAYAKYLDLNMLVLLHGKERTEAEYAALLEAAGLRLVNAVPTSAEISVLVAAPV